MPVALPCPCLFPLPTRKDTRVHATSEARHAALFLTGATPAGALSAMAGGGFAPEVLDFAVYLGIDPEREEDLLWIAHECLSAELPAPWSEHTSSRGDVYFYNAETDESVVEHPLEAQYRAMVEDEKRKRLTGAQDRAADSHGGWSEGGGAADLDDSESAVPIAHSEVVDMALYYDVDPAKETWLLQTVREAVLAPLPWMFSEVKDSSGDPYYYNSVTDDSQREHPLDKVFEQRIASERDAFEQSQASATPDDAWQVFFSSNGSPYFHNFATGEEVRDAPDGMSAEHVRQQIRRDAASRQAQLLGKPRTAARDLEESSIGAEMSGDWQDMSNDPYEGIPDEEVQQMAEMLGLRPSDPKLIKFMRELHQKKTQALQGKTWTTEVYDENKVDMQPPKMRPPPKPPSPPRLVFFSWWYEEGVKKYIELRYDMTAHLFQIILNKTVALKDVKIAGASRVLLPLAALARPRRHTHTCARRQARAHTAPRACRMQWRGLCGSATRSCSPNFGGARRAQRSGGEEGEVNGGVAAGDRTGWGAAAGMGPLRRPEDRRAREAHDANAGQPRDLDVARVPCAPAPQEGPGAGKRDHAVQAHPGHRAPDAQHPGLHLLHANLLHASVCPHATPPAGP